MHHNLNPRKLSEGSRNKVGYFYTTRNSPTSNWLKITLRPCFYDCYRRYTAPSSFPPVGLLVGKSMNTTRCPLGKLRYIVWYVLLKDGMSSTLFDTIPVSHIPILSAQSLNAGNIPIHKAPVALNRLSESKTTTTSGQRRWKQHSQLRHLKVIGLILLPAKWRNPDRAEYPAALKGLAAR